MSIESDLKALEPLAGVIDSGRLLRRSRPSGCVWVMDRGPSGHEVAPSVALAIREKQAREWIWAWCGEHSTILIVANRPVTGEIEIRVSDEMTGMATGRWLRKSLAEAYAACIAKLVGLEEEPTNG